MSKIFFCDIMFNGCTVFHFTVLSFHFTSKNKRGWNSRGKNHIPTHKL